jgi:hypothetical protein
MADVPLSVKKSIVMCFQKKFPSIRFRRQINGLNCFYLERFDDSLEFHIWVIWNFKSIAMAPDKE